MDIRTEVLERFVRYVGINTQSNSESQSYPSTEGQWELLNLLKEELEVMGAEEVSQSPYGYVMATIPASKGCEHAPTIGFIAHVDTSPDLSGEGVRPQIVHYDGGDIPLGEGYILSPKQFPELERVVGHTLITTDGTTLLGADDKAGVAEIMTMAHLLLTHPEVPHGRIRIGFTPDEEIGHGVDHFDVDVFGARYAYTLDGSAEGELEYECFNASGARLKAYGRNVHPGYAKGKMINALEALIGIHAMLPTSMRPELTEGYEGFYHLVQLSGEVEEAESQYIIRDHSLELLQEKKRLLQEAVDQANERWGRAVVTLEMEDQYFNMRSQIEPYPKLIDLAQEAMKLAGVTPDIRPIRGGTDGARLSYMGLPCPNLFAGGMNFHGRYEYASLDVMVRAVETIVHLAGLWGQEQDVQPE